MEFKIYRAKTVNDAITDALIDLETTSDNIEYEVIEEGSTRLLGLFSKEAIVKVRRKEEVIFEEERIELTSAIKETFAEIDQEEKSSKKQAEKPARKAQEKPAAKEKAKQAEQKPAPKPANAVKNAPEKPAKAEQAPEKPAPKPEKKAAPEKSGPKNTDRTAETESVKTVLKAIFEKLDIDADIEVSVDEEEKVFNINVVGDDTGEIIGKRGQTLDAIQYLASIILNKKKDDYYRVKLDTNNYRERRQKTLENLARNYASKVKKTRRKVVLEPMNPYERRVIHSYLQADKYVTTKSEGEEPNRRVVIYYKK